MVQGRRDDQFIDRIAHGLHPGGFGMAGEDADIRFLPRDGSLDRVAGALFQQDVHIGVG
ncbi:hypothetical protein D3C78_1956170 [compost metagenome]